MGVHFNMSIFSFWRCVGIFVPFLAAIGYAQSGPTITQQPQSQYVILGGTVSFSVTATADSPLTYQWRHDTQNIPGANSATLSISDVTDYYAGSYTVVVTAGGVSVASVNAQLTVLVAPRITRQPASVTVPVGDYFYLSTNVTGSSPMTYEWRKDGVVVPNATSNPFGQQATASSAGAYRVTVTNPAGTVTSDTATVTVVDAIKITTPPADQTVSAGASVTFAVAATGAGTLKYQWYKDYYSSIPGATSSTLTLDNVSAKDNAAYGVIVSNEYQTYGVQSASARLTVKAPPEIITQPPSSIDTMIGNSCGFGVSAVGLDVKFQWKKDGINLGPTSKYSGTNSNYLSIYAIAESDAGSYAVEVSNAYGKVTSTAVVISVIQNPNYPTITSQPASVSVSIGDTATFSVTASSWYALSYQWRKNGNNITNGSGNTLTLSGVSAGDAGQYSVVVSNAYGSVISSDAKLTVGAPPSAPVISVQPSDQTVNSGQTVSFSVSAAGNPNPSFQWTKDGSNLSGQTKATLTLTDVQPAQGGLYAVVVSNSLGVVTSSPARLTVTPLTRVVNLSSRAFVGTDDNVLIAGFVIGGTQPKRILIRAVGPTLADFGVSGVLADPRLSLVDSKQQTLAVNDDWETSSDLVQLREAHTTTGAFPLKAGGKDAALLVTLPPGPYTALVSGVGKTTGVALAELYEVDGDSPNELVNISSRAYVAPGEKVLITGLIVKGNGPKKFIIRAVGPGLQQFGVPGLLDNPKLEIVDADKKVVAANDDWGVSDTLAETKSVSSALKLFTLSDGSHDAACMVSLAPGLYTVIVSGVGETSGVALVEAYAVP
ncbi:hypothetical protein DB347_14080 [Opitutaceae bacterium EW11]|nr:hypothetical protein DB347_14080 [Opitutaceae bacterium EW11]